MFGLLVVPLAASTINPMDLVILVDESSSIGDEDFVTELNAISAILNHLPVTTAEVNVSLIAFGTTARTVSNLSGNLASIQSTIDNLFQGYGNTNHAEAFSLAASQFDNHGREGATGIVFLITDGTPTHPSGTALSSAINAANDLKNDGYLLYAIGVGGDVGITDLELYASTPTNSFVSHYDSFADLETAAETLADDILTHSSLAAVPEPSAVAFLIFPISALGMALWRRRARRV
ncbi:MAG: VWA domain-containing protein [Cephaloticoccus sp.]|nr:VWA domain-containing protein [Cephaloticoccus sp.]